MEDEDGTSDSCAIRAPKQGEEPHADDNENSKRRHGNRESRFVELSDDERRGESGRDD